jgi:hypothetical protein
MAVELVTPGGYNRRSMRPPGVMAMVGWGLAVTGCGRLGFDPGGGDDATADGEPAALTTMWVFGGSDGSVTREQVWRSDDGVSWAPVGSLPQPRSRGAVFYTGGGLIFAGGAEGQGTAFGQVWHSADGVTWNAIGVLPIELAGMGYAQLGGRLWLVGGETVGGTSTDVVRASIDGVTWETVGNLPYPVHGGVLVVHGSRMYLVAGHNSAFLDTVISSEDGVTWQTEPSITGSREYHGAANALGQLWLAGGTPGFADVRTLTGGSWTLTSTLPMAADHAFLADYRGRLWLISGAAGEVLSSVDGTTWVDEGSLPSTRSFFNALVTPALDGP